MPANSRWDLIRRLRVNGSRNSAVGIVTWLWAGRSGARFSGRRKKVSLVSKRSIPTLGPTQFPTQWATRAPLPDVKRLGREADHSTSI